jgi:hypothetical protein
MYIISAQFEFSLANVACQKQESDELDYATDVTETLSEKQLHSKGCCGFEARQEFVSHRPPCFQCQWNTGLLGLAHVLAVRPWHTGRHFL